MARVEGGLRYFEALSIKKGKVVVLGGLFGGGLFWGYI